MDTLKIIVLSVLLAGISAAIGFSFDADVWPHGRWWTLPIAFAGLVGAVTFLFKVEQ